MEKFRNRKGEKARKRITNLFFIFSTMDSYWTKKDLRRDTFVSVLKKIRETLTDELYSSCKDIKHPDPTFDHVKFSLIRFLEETTALQMKAIENNPPKSEGSAFTRAPDSIIRDIRQEIPPRIFANMYELIASTFERVKILNPNIESSEDEGDEEMRFHYNPPSQSRTQFSTIRIQKSTKRKP
ncbi:unnamed protein product [Orchesella dallaii]|uniref:Uncharacterized protein n=1 Tax=Orchesella dallaii TaxID=48710 RepID=A0ABP1RLY2_9HEXA